MSQEDLLSRMVITLKQDEQLIKQAISSIDNSEYKGVNHDLEEVTVVDRMIDGSYEILVMPKRNQVDIDLLTNLLHVKVTDYVKFKNRIMELSEFGVIDLFTNDDINLNLKLDDINPSLESILKVLLILGKQMNVGQLNEILVDFGKCLSFKLLRMRTKPNNYMDDVVRVYISNQDLIGYCAIHLRVVTNSNSPIIKLLNKDPEIKINCNLLIFKIKQKLLTSDAVTIIDNLIMSFKLVEHDLNQIDKLLFFENVKIELLKLLK